VSDLLFSSSSEPEPEAVSSEEATRGGGGGGGAERLGAIAAAAPRLEVQDKRGRQLRARKGFPASWFCVLVYRARLGRSSVGFGTGVRICRPFPMKTRAVSAAVPFRASKHLLQFRVQACSVYNVQG